MKSGVAIFLIAISLQAFASPSFRIAPSMHSARAAHTATLLNDGSVLIVGGFQGDESELAGVEIFDATQQKFRALDEAHSAGHTRRQSHTASLLSDGRVFVAGGYGNGRCLDSTEIFDITTQTFSKGAILRTPRCDHTAVNLGDGRIALIGGLGADWTFLDSVEIFDPKTNSLHYAGRLTVPRTGHVSVLLADGRIFIAGGATGRQSTRRVYASTELFDPSTGRSLPAATMSIPRAKLDGVLLADGRVLMTGGADERDARGKYDSAEIYDPTHNAFAAAATMKLSRYKHRGSSVVLRNGWVLIGGGARQPEVYNPDTNVFTLVPVESPLNGSFSAVTLLPGRGVLITGGYNNPAVTTNGASSYQF